MTEPKAGSFHDGDNIASRPQQQELSKADLTPSIYPPFVREYQVLKEALRLEKPVISYPACGIDISLAEVFPECETYYIDNEPSIIDALKTADLPQNSHVVGNSAYEYRLPKPADLVVLRNASTGGDNIGLTKDLKVGGYVIDSHWANTYDAQVFLADPNFRLVGSIAGSEDSLFFDQNTDTIAANLRSDTNHLASKFSGVAFVFRKVSQQTIK